MAIGAYPGTPKMRGVVTNVISRLFTGLCLVSVFSLTFWLSKDAARQIELDEPSTHSSEIPFTSSYLDVTSSKPVASNPIRRWAYAFLVGGVLDPRTDYRGFLYGVVVAAKILRDAGSQADVVIMVQLSYNTNSTRLPQDEEALLAAVGVKIKYLPKFAAKVHEQFYGLVMEKFRILEMTEYSRVLFLDSDIMPVCNLDYMFELSEPPVGQLESATPPALLKGNVVLSWKTEPGHAGFFMLSPGPGKFNEIQQIIRRREEEALNMTYPYWDNEIGWGRRFNNETDYWRSEDGNTGTLWDWWASFADQGLIYYWAKYHEKSTSIIIGHEVETWGTDENGVLKLERIITGGPLNNFTCIPRDRKSYFRASPYRDYLHFTGNRKPWDMNYTSLENLLTSQPRSIQSRWFSALTSVAKETSFNISRSTFGGKKYVGSYSETKKMYFHIVAKKERGWTPYQKSQDR
jgi:hypothetical protein